MGCHVTPSSTEDSHLVIVLPAVCPDRLSVPVFEPAQTVTKGVIAPVEVTLAVVFADLGEQPAAFVAVAVMVANPLKTEDQVTAPVAELMTPASAGLIE